MASGGYKIWNKEGVSDAGDLSCKLRPAGEAMGFIRTETIVGNKAARAVGDIMKRMKAGEQMAPIKVFEQGGKRYVLDGHHRLEAATRLGKTLEYESVAADQLGQYGYKSADDVVQAASEAGAARVKVDSKIVNKTAGQ